MYYFVFTDRYEGDSKVECFCTCDHQVTREEWKEYLAKYQEEWKRLAEASYIAYGKRTGEGHERYVVSSEKDEIWPAAGYYFSLEHEELQKWEEENNPQKTFQKLPNMTVVEYCELSW